VPASLEPEVAAAPALSSELREPQALAKPAIPVRRNALLPTNLKKVIGPPLVSAFETLSVM
jgi:hypothetical protein